MDSSGAVIGTPDEAVERLIRLQQLSGGFGTVLAFGHCWTTREQTLRTYDLLARYVMPRCQGLIKPIEASAARVTANKEVLMEKGRRRDPQSNPRLQRRAPKAEIVRRNCSINCENPRWVSRFLGQG